MILVTGGTGLLGSHLLFDLVRQGKPVKALRRKTSDTAMVSKIFNYYTHEGSSLANKIEWVEGDLLDFGSMEDALEGITKIYHTGAVVSFDPIDHKTMLKVNTEGTANMVNLAIHHGVEKFCFVSSVATLGRADNDGLTSEEDYWVPSRKNSVYAISKYGAEREVWRGMEEGLNAVIINPSVILGPGFWNHSSRLFRMVWEGLKFYTRGINGYVDVRDVSKAMISLMDRDIAGQRFICSSENVTYEALFKMMARYLNKPEPVFNVPMGLASLAWRAETLRAFLTGSRPQITREMAISATQYYTYTHQKLCEAVPLAFIPVEQSIRDICALFIKDHMEKA